MENNNGQHNPIKFVKEIFKAYYGISDDYDKIIFDFDDTIWSRKYKESTQDKKISIENIKIINNIPESIIISGNTYSSISKKLFEVFGTNLSDCNISIWADVNSRLYHKNEIACTIEDFIIPKKDVEYITNILRKLNISYSLDSNKVVNIKIKGLSERERNLLCIYLNETIFQNSLDKYKAIKAGYTTVDIISKKNTSKKAVFDYLQLKDKKTLYIGDELDSGNDKEIAKACTTSINVVDIKETNFILKLLGDFL